MGAAFVLGGNIKPLVNDSCALIVVQKMSKIKLERILINTQGNAFRKYIFRIKIQSMNPVKLPLHLCAFAGDHFFSCVLQVARFFENGVTE
jgi:hypothetical protein